MANSVDQDKTAPIGAVCSGSTLFASMLNMSVISTLDKQRICVNTQLKSSKKQLKRNVCVSKSNSNDRYAITCDVIAYHLVHFISIWVINKCQSGIDFFFPAI